MGLLGKLLEYLDRSALTDTPTLPRPRGVRGHGVSVETVRSRVHQRELAVQKKSSSSSSVAEVTQVQGWITEEKLAPPSGPVAKLQPPLLLPHAAPQAHGQEELQLDVQSHAGARGQEELQLDVQSHAGARGQEDEDVYGYVITDEE